VVTALLLQLSSVARAEEQLPLDCGPDSFTIVGVPDTQGYAPDDDQLLASFRFVLEQRALWDATGGTEGCNIVFVSGYGDVVQNVFGQYGVDQMQHMSEVWATLQDQSLEIEGDPRIPYVVVPGNHDSSTPFGDNDFHWVTCFFGCPATSYLTYFPPERFTAFVEGGSNQTVLTHSRTLTGIPSEGSLGVNLWQVIPTHLDLGGYPLELLHLGLEWGWFSEDAEVLDWAAERVREHPDKLVFVTTHANVGNLGVNPDVCGSWADPPGSKLFHELVDENPAVVSVMNGHFLAGVGTTPECYVRMPNAAGLDTFQFYNNYQMEGPQGERGLGYLVFMTYDLPDAELRVSVYSAVQGFRDGRRSNGEQASTLRFDFDLADRIPYLEPPPACSDSLDNDGDGFVDFPDDPGCPNAEADQELPRNDVAIEFRSRIRLGHRRLLTVTVLGSERVRVSQIDDTTLSFGPAGAAPAFSLSNPWARFFSTRDRNRDGFPDLVLRFWLRDTGLTSRDEQACLQGVVDGMPFEACDAMELQRPRHRRARLRGRGRSAPN